MSSVNKVILIGNLGKDPEIRYLEGGICNAKISLATSESWKDKATGEKKERTEWHNIVLWRALAELAEKYLKKGDKIFIEGRIQTRSYQDKEGNKRYITEIIGDNLTMLSSKNSSEATHKPTPSAPVTDTPLPQNSPEDDLPF